MCVMCVSVYGLKLWNGLPVLTSEVALTKYFPLLIIIIDYHSLGFFFDGDGKNWKPFVILTDCNSHPWPLGGNEHIVTFPYETSASFLLLLIELLHRPLWAVANARSNERPGSHVAQRSHVHTHTHSHLTSANYRRITFTGQRSPTP